VQALALHPDVIVVVSRAYATSATLVRGGGEAFLIDSPVFPDELEALGALAAQAQFPVVGLLTTHADWDHLLGSYAFPDAPLGAAESTAARMISAPGEAQRELREFDEEMYVVRPRPLSLPGAQQLPVPGHLDVGERSLELHPTGGHTVDGMALWAPWAGVLVVGDYLSPVEIPMLSATGSVSQYLSTLRVLEPLVSEAAHVVPGHGGPIDGERALAILREDVAYLEALESQGADAPLPLARRTGSQRAVHAKNVERVTPR
jgi:glyoxylase-like metal-dependent hydrolase (beta-lactamase superfamily II)